MSNLVPLFCPAVVVTEFPALDLTCCRRPMRWRVAREGRTWFGCTLCHKQARVDHTRGHATITDTFNFGAKAAKRFYIVTLKWEPSYTENKE